jgi:hypothetical protein
MRVHEIRSVPTLSAETVQFPTDPLGECELSLAAKTPIGNTGRWLRKIYKNVSW